MIRFIGVFLVILVLCSFTGCRPDPGISALQSAQRSLQSEFADLDRSMSAAASALSGLEYNAQQARDILRELVKGRDYAVDACIVSTTGKMQIVEPEEYREYEGSDISRQEQVVRLFGTGKPVLSLTFRAVEGFEAADIQYPIFGKDGLMKGSVSLLLKPELMLSAVLVEQSEDDDYSLWAMQPDGLILYDPDPQEIGKNTFVDPMFQSFPQLLALGRRMMKDDEGRGSYTFLNTGLEKEVKKEAVWVTAGLYGTEWRLIMSRVIP